MKNRENEGREGTKECRSDKGREGRNYKRRYCVYVREGDVGGKGREGKGGIRK